MKTRLLLFLAFLAASGHSLAQQSLKIGRPVWSALTAEERDKIHAKYVVQVHSPEDYGVLIDNQGVNESTPGTTGGAALGGALAQTTYIDRAMKGGNYSATTQLGLAILGSALGSSLDSTGVQQYHFRYAVRLGSGDVRYADIVQGDAFRHPVGICVSYPNVAPSDEGLCTHTVASFRAKYLEQAPAQLSVATPSLHISSQPEANAAPANFATTGAQVQCKIGTQPAVITSLEKCNLIGGNSF